jgi:hypothetical protein
MPAKPKFEKTPKQHELQELLIKYRHVLAYGGSRSGKSLGLVRATIMRGIMKPSKHLMVRFRFNHARTSLGHETIPFVINNCFPGVDIRENKSDNYWTIPCVGGGESELWLGGTDDKDRIEKVLGSEYSTIYANECSQIPFDAISMLWTRLAENSGLNQRFYYDCNPPGKKHWTHKIFMEGILPDGTPHTLDTGAISMNPTDNLANLSPEYIAALEALPLRQRQRFLLGLYLTDVEGALWTDMMVSNARVKKFGKLRKTSIGVDPSVTNTPHSDECGIMAFSLDENMEGVLHRDHSLKASTEKWAKAVVDAYHEHEANDVVAEVNNGGDLVENVIHQVDPNIKVVKVRAAKGKLARAEPVAHLYEQGKIAHEAEFPDLETELTETKFDEIKASPNRLDALCWVAHHLMIEPGHARIHIG